MKIYTLYACLLFSCLGNKSEKPMGVRQFYPYKKTIALGAFSISGVYGSIGIFVSEMLKNKIEEAGCTGIVFTDVNHRYP